MKWIALTFLLTFEVIAQDVVHGNTDFSGKYAAKGIRPGEAYTATPSTVIQCAIKKNGDYYTIRW